MKKMNAISKIAMPRPLLPPALALRRVTSKSGNGVYASSDELYKGAIFGRDSIEVAEDLLAYKPRLVKRIILTLARLQGEAYNDDNEEEPGKIIHEYRNTVVDGKLIDEVSQVIFDELRRRWGGNNKELAYYGSIDATPHFIRLLGAYCERRGVQILQEKVTLRSGHSLPLAVVLENSLDWLTQKIDHSNLHLLEYQRRNPRGIENQVWKDSGEFYVHENGQFANHQTPIASIEVQGLVYDAFVAAARLLPGKAEEFNARAHAVRDRAIELLWQPDRKYFALGVDYDEKGTQRLISTTTANPAALLDTCFFDALPSGQRELYITRIVEMMFSKEFLTDAGIRSRALKESRLVPFWDYHGSFVSWPKETYDIAKGLRRQGFPLLARELENRLLNIVLKNRQYPEFLYVDEWGRVLLSSPMAHDYERSEVMRVDSTNKPETIQAWTVSAILAITARRLSSKLTQLTKIKAPVRSGWQVDCERVILARIPRVSLLFSPWTLAARYPTYNYKLIADNSKQSSNFLHEKLK